MQAVLDAPDPNSWVGQRDPTLFTVLYNTGARVSAILHLRLDDLVLEGGAPAVHLHGKGRKQRSVPLWGSTASRSWRKRLNDSSSRAFLFPNRGGTLMTRSNVTQRLTDAVGVAAQRFPDLPRRSVLRTPSATQPQCTFFSQASTMSGVSNSLVAPTQPARVDRSRSTPCHRQLEILG
jgi:integrase